MVKPLWAEIRDQVLHVTVAVVLTALFVFFPVLAAAVLVMGVGIVRELIQHDWQAVGKLDLIFWAVGCALFLLAYYLLDWLVGVGLFTVAYYL
jgi:hypothetical protein